MVHARDDAFEGKTRSVGCAAALLPQQLRVSAKSATTWYRRKKTISSLKASGDSEAPPPLSLESSGAPRKGEEAKTPTLGVVDAWREMGRRFRAAHGLLPSDGEGVAPARWNAGRRNSCSLLGREMAPWVCESVSFDLEIGSTLSGLERKHGLSAEQVPVSAYVGSSNNLKDLQNLKADKAPSASPGVRVAKSSAATGLPLCSTIYPPWCH
ncbi:hypothetical protein T484DRAFT_1845856 [Baffinella frigidus]|nr:hypothetical protein T484DRAFT_1845856 [Cryptophyta sp. CCMP2293]